MSPWALSRPPCYIPVTWLSGRLAQGAVVTISVCICTYRHVRPGLTCTVQQLLFCVRDHMLLTPLCSPDKAPLPSPWPTPPPHAFVAFHVRLAFFQYTLLIGGGRLIRALSPHSVVELSHADGLGTAHVKAGVGLSQISMQSSDTCCSMIASALTSAKISGAVTDSSASRMSLCNDIPKMVTT